MGIERKKIVPAFVCGLGGFFVAAMLIFLTPLKWVTILEPKIHDITPKEFFDAYQRNPDKYLFIDVRPADAYTKIHAKGSHNMPLHTLYNERKRLPKFGKEIVLICSGGSASGVAYSYLEHYGFFNIRRIAGGIERWQDGGLPIVVKPLFDNGASAL